MPKAPSFNELRSEARQFAARWKGTTSERGEAQSFWNEFFGIFGIDRKRVAVFEKAVKRTSTGKDGRIDLYFPGVLVAEHKSEGKSLEEAEAQALDYLASLDAADTPNVVITSDFAHLRLLDLASGEDPITIRLEELPQHIELFAFIAGYRRRTFTAEQEEAANINAAKLMGRLYEGLAGQGYPEHDTSVLLARLLFLMFADDTAMWERSLFTEFLTTRTYKDGSDTGAQLAALFQTLNTPVEKRLATMDEALLRFPYVNGGLFQEVIRIPFFDREMREELVAACAFDWSSISPAIFGSMFQAVKDDAARRSLGEHYTTEKNILKVIHPLFLDELRERFESAKHDARRLRALRNELGTYTFLDPACGCGNFLIVGYRELRRLEFDILVALRDLSGDHQLALDVSLDLSVNMEQFAGIEIDEWASMIAETAMFLVDQQENIALAAEFGEAPDRLPITSSARITKGANAIHTDWAEAAGLDEGDLDKLIILGNPPFIGMSYMSDEQTEDLRAAFAPMKMEGLRTGRLDYVTAWYAKAIQLLEGTKGRAAFVSTNSITQGEQARSMVPFLSRHGFEVDFGHRTFLWTSEAPNAASVHCVIVGFSPEGGRKRRRLYEYPSLRSEPVERIPKRLNFYLTEGEDIVPAKLRQPAVPGMPYATQGNKPWDGGYLLFDPDKHPEDYQRALADPVASKYLRPFYQGSNMLNGKERWCLWLVEASPEELRSSSFLRERLAGVVEVRKKTKTKAVQELAAYPSRFVQIRQPDKSYFALPEVSSGNREWVPGRFLSPDDIAGNKLIIFPGAELWHFAYLQSSLYMAWVRTFAGRLKSDISISPALAYFPVPFRVPNDKQVDRLTEAGYDLLGARDSYQGASLADLYDPLTMPKRLVDAHRNLDAAVDSLHGLRKPTEADRLKVLLRDYEAMIAPLTTAAEKASRRR